MALTPPQVGDWPAKPEASFFLVWSPGGLRPPSVRHPTVEAAEAEARRLAAQNPGQDFFVLGSLSVSRQPVAAVTTRGHSLARDLIPF